MKPFDLEARILHEADGVIVVNKPVGWPSTGRDLDDPKCVQHLLMARARRMVWAVHQLDADTSGVNVFVRRKSLVEPWAQKLRKGRKEYLALCVGHPRHDNRRIDEPIGWDKATRRRWVTPDGQKALSQVKVLERRDDGTALVRVQIHTGRTHQIRIHMAWLGHPLVGEQRYVEPACTRRARHALHAHRLILKDQTFEAPFEGF